MYEEDYYEYIYAEQHIRRIKRDEKKYRLTNE